MGDAVALRVGEAVAEGVAVADALGLGVGEAAGDGLAPGSGKANVGAGAREAPGETNQATAKRQARAWA